MVFEVKLTPTGGKFGKLLPEHIIRRRVAKRNATTFVEIELQVGDPLESREYLDNLWQCSANTPNDCTNVISEGSKHVVTTNTCFKPFE